MITDRALVLRRKEAVGEGVFSEMAFKLDLTMRSREGCSRQREQPRQRPPALAAAVEAALSEGRGRRSSGWAFC